MSENTNSSNYLVFNLNTFKKTSKRLQHILFYSTEEENIRKHRNFPISEFHEMLSKSLGFRNYDAIQKYFNKQGSLPAARTGAFFEDWSAKEIIELFSLFLENNSSNEGREWKGQALSLISTIAITLKYMEEEKEILLDINCFQEFFKLENVLKLYKTRRDFPQHIRNKLWTYLTSIPGFQKMSNDQYDSALEYHNYIYFNLLPIVSKLQDIESHDPIIINPCWYNALYSQESSDNTTENSDIKYFKIRLSDHSIEDIAKPFKHEDWLKIFAEKGLRYEPYISFIDSNQQRIKFYDIKLIDSIERDFDTENTWLKDSLYEKILNGFLKNQQLKTYYLSDLLLYSFKIINQKKRDIFIQFISNLIKNYSYITEYSKKLELLAK